MKELNCTMATEYEIKINSKIGEGTTMIVRIPAQK